MAGSRRRLSRRTWIVSGLAAVRSLASDIGGTKGAVYEREWTPYPDGTTEFQVYRLTDPSYRSFLPGPSSRVISRNSAVMLYASERSGPPQAFRMDLKSGETQQLTDRKGLDGASLTLLPDSRSFCYFADQTLYATTFSGLKERSIYTVPTGWERGSDIHATADGAHLLIVERREAGSRLRSIPLAAAGGARTIVEAPFAISEPMERPLHAQILYRQPGKGLWLTNTDGQQNHELKLADGTTGPANWAANGRTLLYLNFPADSTQLNTLRELTPGADADKLVAKTSQFADFGCNRDTSVFVGASRNAASPTILILLRVTRRELTLCEHRAKHPETVAPMFSPDAQRIYFQSDLHGAMALYSVHVEKLVEKIEGDNG